MKVSNIMIYVFGDSHADFNLRNFDLLHINLCEYSTTMHRIGRDNIIVNFDNSYNNKDNIFIFFYGEVDSRCHIQRQIDSGRNLDEVIDTLVSNYFNTIYNNITEYNKIIISSIVPPVNRAKHESIHGVITHEFPILGTDKDRIVYTTLMNNKLKEYCNTFNFIFLDFYDYYVDNNGLLIFEKSDTNSHIVDNAYIHSKLKEILNS